METILELVLNMRLHNGTSYFGDFPSSDTFPFGVWPSSISVVYSGLCLFTGLIYFLRMFSHSFSGWLEISPVSKWPRKPPLLFFRTNRVRTTFYDRSYSRLQVHRRGYGVLTSSRYGFWTSRVPSTSRHVLIHDREFRSRPDRWCAVSPSREKDLGLSHKRSSDDDVLVIILLDLLLFDPFMIVSTPNRNKDWVY